MDDEEIRDAVGRYAPELDPDEVREFMAAHRKPDDEPDPHVLWAIKVLRQRGEGQYGDGASLDAVKAEMRRHDGRR